MKKTLLLVGAVAICLATVPLFAAFEAHVINVTAHIENALSVDTTPIEYGIVFPEEVRHRTFQVDCSTSFQQQERIDDIHYKIVQKPKPKTVEDPRDLIYPRSFPNGIAAWNYCLNQTSDPEYLTYCYRNLCPFLQKMSSEGEGDTEESAYLAQSEKDCEDTWSIAFDVPCIEGYEDQEGKCSGSVPAEDDYGCDLWIEVTDFSQWE